MSWAPRRTKYWNPAVAARALPRFDFIAEFVAHMTAQAADRRPVNGMCARHLVDGWAYGFHDFQVPVASKLTVAQLYERMIRSPLNHYVRMAEDLRSDALS